MIGFLPILFHLLFFTFFIYYFLVSQTSQTHFSLSLLSLFLSGSFVCRRLFGQLIVRKLVHFVYYDWGVVLNKVHRFQLIDCQEGRVLLLLAEAEHFQTLLLRLVKYTNSYTSMLLRIL